MKNILNLLLFSVCILLAFLFAFISVSDAKPIKIAVIDGPLPEGVEKLPNIKLCNSGHFDYKNMSPTIGKSSSTHAFKIMTIISNQVNKDMCFLHYTVNLNTGTQKTIALAIKRSLSYGVKYINISIVARYPNQQLREQLLAAAQRGVVIFLAAGNESINLDKYCTIYPACYKLKHKNIHVVGALSNSLYADKYSNYGSVVTTWEIGEILGSFGTSFANPQALSRYINTGGK